MYLGDDWQIEILPFISSSMIRNKMINLLAKYYGKEINNKIHTCNEADCFLCLLFGLSGHNKRLIIRDSNLSDKNKNFQKSKNFPWEFKLEGNHLIKRIPPKVLFDVEFVYRIFVHNKDEGIRDCKNFKYILEGLELIEEDYLGSGGSRGSGKICFSNMTLHKFRYLNTIDISVASGWTIEKKSEGSGEKLARTVCL